MLENLLEKIYFGKSFGKISFGKSFGKNLHLDQNC